VRNGNAERAVVATVALGAMLAPLNSTMIAVALPRIIDDFGSSVRAAGWLVTSYLIALAVVQPFAGRLGDAFGRRTLMLAGLIGFGLASVGAAAAPDLPVLVCFRIAQAVSGAVVFPNGVALLQAVLPSARRGRGFGTVGSALAGSAALGPLVGGALIAGGGWRLVFSANLPIVAAALALTWRYVPAARGSSGGGAPFLGAGLWRTPRFAAASAGVAFSNLSFYSLLITTPVLLARRHGWSSGEIGLALAALSAPSAVLAPVGGRLSDHLGRRAPALAGNGLIAAATLPLFLDPGLAPAALVVCLALTGAGVGLSAASLQTSAVEAVAPAFAGSAAGMYSTSRYLGSIAGTAALGSLLTAHGSGGYGAVFAMVFASGVASAAVTLGLAGHEAHLEPEPTLTA
jgi:MFS family permease